MGVKTRSFISRARNFPRFPQHYLPCFPLLPSSAAHARNGLSAEYFWVLAFSNALRLKLLLAISTSARQNRSSVKKLSRLQFSPQLQYLPTFFTDPSFSCACYGLEAYKWLHSFACSTYKPIKVLRSTVSSSWIHFLVTVRNHFD